MECPSPVNLNQEVEVEMCLIAGAQMRREWERGWGEKQKDADRGKNTHAPGIQPEGYVAFYEKQLLASPKQVCE